MNGQGNLAYHERATLSVRPELVEGRERGGNNPPSFLPLSRNPSLWRGGWIPAFAGMTTLGRSRPAHMIRQQLCWPQLPS